MYLKFVIVLLTYAAVAESVYRYGRPSRYDYRSRLGNYIPGYNRIPKIPKILDFTKFFPEFEVDGNLGSYLSKISGSLKGVDSSGLGASFGGDLSNLMKMVANMGGNMPNKLNILNSIFGNNQMTMLNKVDFAKRVLNLGGEGNDVANIGKISDLISNWNKDSVLPDLGDAYKWIPFIGEKGMEIPFIGDLAKYIPNFDMKGNFESYLGNMFESIKSLGGNNIPFVGDLGNLISEMSGIAGNMPNKMNIMKKIFSLAKMDIQMKINLARWILSLGQKGVDLGVNGTDTLEKMISNIGEGGCTIGDFTKLGEWVSGLGGNFEIPFIGDFSKFIPNFDFSGDFGSYLGNLVGTLKSLGEKGMNIPFVGDLSDLMKKVSDFGDKMPNKMELTKQIFNKAKIPIEKKMDLVKQIMGLGGEENDISNIDNIMKFISNLGCKVNMVPDLKGIFKWIPGMDGAEIDFSKFIPNFDMKGHLDSYLKGISESLKGLGGKEFPFVEDLEHIVSKVAGQKDNMPNKCELMGKIFNLVKMDIGMKVKLAKWILSLGGNGVDMPNMDNLFKFISNIGGDGNTAEDFFKLSEWISGLGDNFEMPSLKDISKFIPKFDFGGNIGSYLQKITDSLKNIGGKGLEIPFIDDLSKVTKKINDNSDKTPNKLDVVKQIFNKGKVPLDKKTELAKQIVEAEGEDYDITDIKDISEFITNLDDESSVVPDFKELTRLIVSKIEKEPSVKDILNEKNVTTNEEATKSKPEELENRIPDKNLIPKISEFINLIPKFDKNDNLESHIEKITDLLKDFVGKGKDMPFVEDLNNLKTKISGIGDKMPNKLEILKRIFNKGKIPLGKKAELAKQIIESGDQEYDLDDIEDLSEVVTNLDDKSSELPDLKDLSKWIPGIGEKGIDLPVVGDFSKLIPNFDKNENIESYLEKISKIVKDNGGKEFPVVKELEDLKSKISVEKENVPNKFNLIENIFNLVKMDIGMKVKIAKWILSLGGNGSDLPNMDILNKFISNIGGNGNTVEDFSKLSKWISGLGGNFEMPFMKDLSNFIPTFGGNLGGGGNLGSYLQEITDSLKNVGLKMPDGDLSILGNLSVLTEKIKDMGDKKPNKLKIIKEIFNKSKIPVDKKTELAKQIIESGGEDNDISDIDEASKLISKLEDESSIVTDLKEKLITDKGEKDTNQQIIKDILNRKKVTKDKDATKSIFGKFWKWIPGKNFIPKISDLTKFIPKFDINENLGSYIENITDSFKDVASKGIDMPFVEDLTNLKKKINDLGDKMPNKLDVVKQIFNKDKVPIDKKTELAKQIIESGGEDYDISDIDEASKLISKLDDESSTGQDFKELFKLIPGIGGNKSKLGVFGNLIPGKNLIPKIGDFTNLIPKIGDFANFVPKFDISGNLGSYLGDITDSFKGLVAKGIDIPFLGDLTNLMEKVKDIGNRMPNKMQLLKQIFNKSKMSIQNKIIFAKQILGLRGKDKDISRIGGLSKFISNWVDGSGLIPDLSKWIGRKNKGGDREKLSIHIPILDKNEDLSLYLKKITNTLITKPCKGKDALLEDLGNLTSDVDENKDNIPNKLKIVRQIFSRVSMPIEEKTKLSKWVLTLGGKGTDLSNIDTLHKIVSNIDGDGNTKEDFKELTNWVSDLKDKSEMPFIGELSNFLPRYDLEENLGSYLNQVNDYVKVLGGKEEDIPFVEDLGDVMTVLDKNEAKLPNKVTTVKDIFHKPSISMGRKSKLAKLLLELGGKERDIANFNNVADLVENLQKIQGLFQKVTGDDKYFPTCNDFCDTLNVVGGKKFTKSDLNLLKEVVNPLSDETKYYHTANRWILDYLRTPEMSFCSSVSVGRQLVSANKVPKNECKVRCIYRNEEETLNFKNGWRCNDNLGVCYNGACLLEAAA